MAGEARWVLSFRGANLSMSRRQARNDYQVRSTSREFTVLSRPLPFHAARLTNSPLLYNQKGICVAQNDNDSALQFHSDQPFTS